MNLNILSALGIFATSLISAWATLRYVVLGTYRLNSETSKRIVEEISMHAKWVWLLSSDKVTPPRSPSLYEAIACIKGIPIYFSRNERLLTAGWKGKEDISSITFLRWHRRTVDSFVAERESTRISISALSVNDTDKLGELDANPRARVYLNKGSYEDIEAEVKRVSTGALKKTGVLLYGRPGNGKTQFVKYVARKYSLPILVVYLRPDYDNFDIAKMFSEIPPRCIVLLEDFDNYFAGRECIMKNEQVRFTYDAIINSLDGVHNDYKGVVFIMTANDIDKIDESLKNRPSRFKFVRKFEDPDRELRLRILGDVAAVDETDGCTLDQVFAKKNRHDDGGLA